jgi:hypothetical protein
MPIIGCGRRRHYPFSRKTNGECASPVRTVGISTLHAPRLRDFANRTELLRQIEHLVHQFLAPFLFCNIMGKVC